MYCAVSQGAARRLTTQKKNVEVDSVGVAGKSGSNRSVKYFIQEVRELSQVGLHIGSIEINITNQIDRLEVLVVMVAKLYSILVLDQHHHGLAPFRNLLIQF